MENLNLSPGTKLVYSEKTAEIIWNLVEKHNLNKKILEKKEVKERLKGVENPLTRQGIQFFYGKQKLGETPFAKLKNIVERLFKKEVVFEDLPETIQKELEASLKTSKELAKDLETSFSLAFEKEKFYEKNLSFANQEKLPIEEENESIEEKIKQTEKENKKENNKNYSYREPLED
jgi:hypothetical protein